MKSLFLNIFLTVILILSFVIVSNNEAQAVDLQQEKAQLLESIGVLSSSNLYLVYLSLSLINENIVNHLQLDGYQDILDSIENINQLTEENLKKIRNNVSLSDTDIDFIDNIEKACVILKEDSSLLNRYLKSKKESDYELFFSKHTEAGKYLEILFNNK